MCRAQYGMPLSRSASGAPQKKNFAVPGRPCGQRQLVLVNSSSDLCCGTFAADSFARLIRAGLCLRRAGPTFDSPGPPVTALAGFATPVPAAGSRSRKIFPSTADRDNTPRRSAMTVAVRPSLQSLRNISRRSGVQDSARMLTAPLSSGAISAPQPLQDRVKGFAYIGVRSQPRVVATVTVYVL